MILFICLLIGHGREGGGLLIGMLDPAGASTLGASTCWDQRVSAPAVGTDDADDDDFLLLLLIL